MVAELKELLEEPEVAKILRKIPGVDLEELKGKDPLELNEALRELARLPGEKEWRSWRRKTE